MSVLNDTKFLAGAWRLSGDGSDGTLRYPGTLVNTPTWATFIKNGLQCIELDGDDAHVNVGDVVELNAVSAFTICFWMNQDVLDIADQIFLKGTGSADANRLNIITSAGGSMFVEITGATNYGTFDYSTVISAGTWHHAAMVYDGSQTGDANRLMFYVDGVPVTLAFTGTIPAATADLSGTNVTLGFSAQSLDGKLFDMRVYTIPLSRDQINLVMHRPLPVL